MLRHALCRPLRRVAASSSPLPRTASLPFRGLHTSPAAALQTATASTPSSTPTEATLHEAFDSPTSSYTSSPSSTSSPSGLFGQPSLTHPSAFPALASRTTLRAKLIVQRLCEPKPLPSSVEEAEIAFLAMVKNLDRLSDLLCGVIDLAELVRNVHPDPAWVEGANEAYEQLCEYMNELNTHVGLYEGLKSLHSLLPTTTPQKSPALFAAYAVATPFLRDFEKSGIHLPPAQRAEFVSLSTAILQLGRRFLQNAADQGEREPVKVDRFEVEAAFGPAHAKRLLSDSPEGSSYGFVDPSSWEGRILARHHPSAKIRRDLYIYSPQPLMTWLDTLTSTPVLIAGALGITAAVYAKRNPTTIPSAGQMSEQAKEVAQATQAEGTQAKVAQAGASVMSPPSATLALPKEDPISVTELAKYDGSDPSKPIYVAIKGRVFDVSHKKDMYGKGTGYNVFAGKDASKGLGMSSLDPKDAVPDYSGLNDGQRKTLDQWESFFEKRYNIVGKVVP